MTIQSQNNILTAFFIDKISIVKILNISYLKKNCYYIITDIIMLQIIPCF